MRVEAGSGRTDFAFPENFLPRIDRPSWPSPSRLLRCFGPLILFFLVVVVVVVVVVVAVVGAWQRGLLEELEQAASGRLDFRTPVREREKQAQLDRQLLPYVSVFEARTTPTTDTGTGGPGSVAAGPADRDRQNVSAFPNLSGFATPGAGVLVPAASPSRPQLMSRRDEIEAESAFDFQNVEVSYAQMITKLGLDTLDQDASECLRNSFIELEAFCLKQSYQLQSLTQRMMHNTVKSVLCSHLSPPSLSARSLSMSDVRPERTREKRPNERENNAK